MGDKTGIAWTDATWNPVRGCSRVSEGCRHCYAEEVAAKYSQPGGAYHGLAKRTSGGEARWTGDVRFIEGHLLDPVKWKSPRRIFVNSMSDLFHEKLGDDLIDRIFAIMAIAKHHTYQILTKRPKRMREYLNEPGRALKIAALASPSAIIDGGQELAVFPEIPWPLPQVHIGASMENQDAADDRMPDLLGATAAFRFLSLEPLLGPIDLLSVKVGHRGPDSEARVRSALMPCSAFAPRIGWVIVGGESGKVHRMMQLAWLERIVDDCRRAGVPVFVKQDSGRLPGKRGRIPEDLYVQEFPS